MNNFESGKSNITLEEAIRSNGEKGNTSPRTYMERGKKSIAANQSSSPEQDRGSIISRLCEKAKAHPTAYAAVVTGALVATVGLGVIFGGGVINPNNPDSTTSITAERKESKGIYDGYSEKGMWLSESKGGEYDFASAKEVAEVCDNDECEMIKYTAHNQVESFADYIANLPGALQPEGFKGVSLLEAEKRLESLSDEQYEEIEKQFGEIMDRAFTRNVTISGPQDNAYMRSKDSSDAITHENMEVVACTTNENNLEVTQFYWTDENRNEIGSMNVKMIPVRDENRNIIGFKGCEQVVGGKPLVYAGLPRINEIPSATPYVSTPKSPNTPPSTPQKPDDPPKDTPSSTPSTPEAPKKEWGKSGDPHGGPDVSKSDKVDPKSEVSKEQNDNTNKGNQGNASTTPGSSSKNTSNPDRKTGGVNQGGNTINGQNKYQDKVKIDEGKKVDQAGNASQAAAQQTGGENGTGAKPGGDNYSDAGEEQAFINGDF